MVRAYLKSAVAGLFLLGMTTAALAATGEYGNMDAMALAQGQVIKTDCSISSQVDGKTYCFGSQTAMTQFMQNPKRHIRKAQANYQNLQ